MKRREKMLLSLLVVLAIIAVVFAGCKQTGEPAEKGVSTIYVQMRQDPGNWQPSMRNINGFVWTRIHYYETLFHWNYENECVPLLAESFEWTDDNHIRVKIHDDIITHNGTPIKASDVMFSYLWAKESGEFVRHTMNINWDNSKVIDDYTVEFEVIKPNMFFMNDLSRIDIVSEKDFNDSEDKMLAHPVGTGPYKFVEYEEGLSITLEKFDNYWMKDNKSPELEGNQLQNVDRIVYRFITEPAQRSIELETGGLDAAYDPPLTDLASFEESDEFNVHKQVLNGAPALYFNSHPNSPCNNTKLRQAIAYAIDNEAIVQAVFNGFSAPCVSVVTPLNTEWKEEWWEDNQNYPYNLEMAKQLLSETGYQPGELHLTIASDERPTRTQMAEIIQAAVAAIGIDLKIDIYDSGTFNSILPQTDTWDMQINGYAAKGSIAFFFNNQVNTDKLVRGHWINDQFQTLLHEALITADQDKIDQCLQIFTDEVPIYPLVYNVAFYVYRKGYDGLRVKDDGWMLPSDQFFTEEADWLYD